MRKRHCSLIIVGLVVLAASLEACAARGPRNRTRVAALAVGESALALDQVERQLYAADVYDKTVHDQLGAVVLNVLYAARGFERAAAEWPESSPLAPATVDAAKAALLAALEAVERIAPSAAAAREPLVRALAAIRLALEAQS